MGSSHCFTISSHFRRGKSETKFLNLIWLNEKKERKQPVSGILRGNIWVLNVRNFAGFQFWAWIHPHWAVLLFNLGIGQHLGNFAGILVQVNSAVWCFSWKWYWFEMYRLWAVLVYLADHQSDLGSCDSTILREIRWNESPVCEWDKAVHQKRQFVWCTRLIWRSLWQCSPFSSVIERHCTFHLEKKIPEAFICWTEKIEPESLGPSKNLAWDNYGCVSCINSHGFAFSLKTPSSLTRQRSMACEKNQSVHLLTKKRTIRWPFLQRWTKTK